MSAEPSPVFAELFPLSNTIAHKATARGGPLGLPVRLVRRIFKAFLRPWLDYQTRYNHTLIHTLDRLWRAQAQQQARLDAVEAMAVNAAGGLEAMNSQAAEALHAAREARFVALDCREQLNLIWLKHQQAERVRESRLEQRLEALEGGPRDPDPALRLWDGLRAGGAADPEEVERAFVRSRLPAPPCRVLAIAGDAELPFEDGSFDAAVVPAGSDGAATERAAQALKPGGRVVLTARPGDASLAAALKLFRQVEAFHIDAAGRAADGLPDGGEATALWVGEKA